MLLHPFFSEIPRISPEKKYWFIRTYAGETFDHYFDNGYVGIGVNNVPQSYIEDTRNGEKKAFLQLQSFIDNNTLYKRGSATKMARDLMSFNHEIKEGDTVIIPSTNSHELALGTVESDVYIVKDDKSTFKFKNRFESYPEKRRKISWDKKIYRDELNGELRSLISSHHGLTNATEYADIIQSVLGSLYVKGDLTYYSLKINQNEDINAFVLSRFLDGLTYFYQEFTMHSGEEIDEALMIKIRVQSRGKLAMKGLKYAGVVALAALVTFCNNNSVDIEMENVKAKFKNDGFLKTYTDFLDAKQEREIRLMQFKDSLEQLKALRYDKSLKSVKDSSNRAKAEGE